MPKKGLGRGLGALITEEGPSGNEIREIFLSDLDPNPGQPRKEFDEERLNELAQSIREHGLLQPILVRPNGRRFYIVAGERRFRASTLAGFEKINCIVLDECDEQSMTEKALIENIQRDDLSPLEEGWAYARLIDEYNLTQEEIANRVGKSRSTITNLLRVIQLPGEILDMLNKEAISLGHAKVLLSLDGEEAQVALARRIVNEGLSVRRTEEVLKEITSSPPPSPSAMSKKAFPVKEYSYLTDIEEQLRSLFQTKVKLKGTASKGKIEIEYFSREDLERLMETWHVAM
ncbi:MAG: ParB/RepB/Spo0J family partition protein [Peptococcaceae bacterium]|nr:ParB/RepB/Spo0J family partition protein [Peptococcaceae bacterium]